MHHKCGADISFLDYTLTMLRDFCPEFDWRHDMLNAKDYLLPHTRPRVFVQGARRSLIGTSIPAPLPTFGVARSEATSSLHLHPAPLRQIGPVDALPLRPCLRGYSPTISIAPPGTKNMLQAS